MSYQCGHCGVAMTRVTHGCARCAADIHEVCTTCPKPVPSPATTTCTADEIMMAFDNIKPMHFSKIGDEPTRMFECYGARRELISPEEDV